LDEAGVVTLFGTFSGGHRFVGLVVTQANRRLCHMTADQLVP
jgi:hypothetical protein